MRTITEKLKTVSNQIDKERLANMSNYELSELIDLFSKICGEIDKYSHVTKLFEQSIINSNYNYLSELCNEWGKREID